MKVSTRNQLKGTVSSIKKGAVNSEVILDLPGSAQITAIITNGAVANLGLTEGEEALALIKASNVILGTDVKQISARNLLCGKIVSVTDGAVNAEVSVDLGEGTVITSIITEASVKRLGLSSGQEVCAIFKASSVILATL